MAHDPSYSPKLLTPESRTSNLEAMYTAVTACSMLSKFLVGLSDKSGARFGGDTLAKLLVRDCWYGTENLGRVPWALAQRGLSTVG